jgi:hypothetical protein
LRQRREREEAEIERQTAIEKAKLKELKEQARLKAIEDWTAKNLGDHIFVTIRGQRLRKLKSFSDIACAKCHNPLYRGRGMAIEAAENLKISAPGSRGWGSRTSVMIESVTCATCCEPNRTMVQVVR